MNTLLEKAGVPPNVKVVDVYSLDADMLAFVPQPVAALLLLYPYNSKVSLALNSCETLIPSFFLV